MDFRTEIKVKKWFYDHLEYDESYELQPFKSVLIEDCFSSKICMCCKQHVKVYRVPLGSSLAIMLIRFFNAFKDDNYHHIDEIVKKTNLSIYRAGIWARSKYFGLTEEMKKDPEKDTKNSGYWKLTDLGKDFVERKLKVKSHFIRYDSNLICLDGDLVSIEDCLKKKFSYSELMRGF